MSAPAPPAAPWEIKAARLLIRLLEDRNAPVDERLRILASSRLPQKAVRRQPQSPPRTRAIKNPTPTRSLAENSLAGYRMILRNHPDLSDEERRVIEDSIKQTEELLGILRQEEQEI